MQATIEELSAIIERAAPLLRGISEEQSRERVDDQWTMKEVLGHMIDSASNNQHKWVRGQLEDGLVFPGYAQEGWVSAQAYREEPWARLVELWQALNLHLLHVMANVPEATLGHRCTIGGDAPVTLGFLLTDYSRHLAEHLRQLFGDGWDGQR
jgi:hypothetical protein